MVITMFDIELKNDYSERIHYNVPDTPVYISKNQLETIAGTSVECHWHDEVEFLLMIKGKIKYNITGENIELNGGDVLFVNSKQTHFGYATENSVCEYICVILNTRLLCTNKHIERNFIAPFLDGGASYIHFNKDVDWSCAVRDILYSLWDAFNDKDESKVLTIHALFYNLWSVFYKNRNDIMKSVSEDTDISSTYNENLDVLKEMVGFIHTNFNERISLEDISTAGTVCRSRCALLFKTFLNQTPIGYLTSYRLGKSALMLQNTELPITEIALSTGFSGTSYFSETFKKHYSCSPSEFRSSQKTV